MSSGRDARVDREYRQRERRAEKLRLRRQRERLRREAAKEFRGTTMTARPESRP